MPAAGPESTPGNTPIKDAAASEKASDAAPSPDATTSHKLATWAFKTKAHDKIERLIEVLEKAKAGQLLPPSGNGTGWPDI
eukprot:gene17930-24324_t